MYQVNRSENRLVRLEERRFADLNFRERDHLQEWLVRTPDALGEDLLIIQKEFDGFAATRERLDILALDKERRLVVIENKLDDSGRDVVWQALKYVAYCSTLKKTQIVEIYQKYLDQWSENADAATNIRQFLGVEDLDEVVLNPGNDQRLVLVAANFRKEVTAAVLWLIGQGVRAQCFRIVPHSFGEEVFVDLQQIIPTPEAADYVISLAAKDHEEKSIEGAMRRSHKLRQEFWTKALEELRDRNIDRFQNISPSNDHWLACATGVSGFSYKLVFLQEGVRVELYLQRSEAENKRFFDRLKQESQGIESRFGQQLEWQRMDGSKGCRICHSHSFSGFERENWPEMIDWLCEHIVKLEKAFSEPLSRVSQDLKARGGKGVSDPNALQAVPDA